VPPLRTAVIRLEGMTFRAFHGVLPEERKLGGPFRVDLTLTVEAPPQYRDRLSETLDYRLAHARVVALMTRRKFRTLEALADAIAEALVRLAKVVAARVRVTKLSPPLGPGTTSAVDIERRR
jgi:dihydroneopterin aldolase